MTEKDKRKLRSKLKKYKEEEKVKFYSLEEILKLKADWNIIFGSRGPGKSYAVREFSLDNVIEDIDRPDTQNDKKFLYLRRYKDNITVEKVKKWFNDIIMINRVEKEAGETENKLSRMTNGRFNNIECQRNNIYLVKYNEEGERVDKYHCGYYYSINDCTNIKSLGFPDCNTLIYEEFISDLEPYAPNEFEKLKHILHTIGRGYSVHAFLLGNNDDRNNMYFTLFGLDNVKRQKEGTIELYEHFPNEAEGETVKYDDDGNIITTRIAVEYTDNSLGVKSTQFYGLDNGSIKGGWSSISVPKMEIKKKKEGNGLLLRYVRPGVASWDKSIYNKYDEMDENDGNSHYIKIDVDNNTIFRMGFERGLFKWNALFMIDDSSGGAFWYIYPLPDSLVFPPYTRIVSDKIYPDPLISSNLKPLTEMESKAFDFLFNGKVFYSDDLTGTEFKRALEFFRTNNSFSTNL